MDKTWEEAVDLFDKTLNKRIKKKKAGELIFALNEKRKRSEYRRQHNKAIRDLRFFMENHFPATLIVLTKVQECAAFLQEGKKDKKGNCIYAIISEKKIVGLSPAGWPVMSELGNIPIGVVPGKKSQMGSRGTDRYYLTPQGFGTHRVRNRNDFWGDLLPKSIRFRRVTSISRIVEIFCDFDDPEKWPSKLLPYLRGEISKRAGILRTITETLKKQG